MSDQIDGVPVVFVSSTSEDLKPYRDSAREAALTAVFLPRMMEYFVASGDKPPLAKCLERVSEADVVVVIVAHRYGWVPADQPSGQPDGDHKSITWLECQHALVEHGRDRELLAFVIADKASWPEELREEHQLALAVRDGRFTPDLAVEVQRNVARLRDFRQWLERHAVRATFTGVDELGRKVEGALREWRERHSRPVPTASMRPAVANATRYLRALERETAWIDIRGLQVGTGKAHRFPIADLYMSLTTTASGTTISGRAGIRPKPAGDTLPRPAATTLTDALAHQRLVVVGDPGSGKSTFLRRVANALSRARLGDDPDVVRSSFGLPGSPFPVLIRIAELADHIADVRKGTAATRPATPDAPAWLWHFLAARSDDEGWGLDADFFRRQLEGDCLLLLDGLDEAPDRRSRESLARLIEHQVGERDLRRIVVTSRPGAHTGQAVLTDFRQVQIDPLDTAAINGFLERWSQALHPDGPAEASRHRDELAAALAVPEIARMAPNPVMLTALAVVHWNEHRLPEQRAELYESIVTWLSRSREQRPGRAKAERCVELLQELALAMQTAAGGRQTQIIRRSAAEAIVTEFKEDSERASIAAAEAFLAAEELDSGIVVGRGNELRFWHLTFQEFLAARAIAARGEAEQRAILWDGSDRLYTPEWREVALLLGGVLHKQGRPKVEGLFKAALDDLRFERSLAEEARTAGLLGAIVHDLAPVDYTPADGRYLELLHTVSAIFDREISMSISIEVRIEAADALGQAGDPRLEPDHPGRWITIAAGAFQMGSASVWSSEDESPVHRVELNAYRIATYPVTVTEYRKFVDTDGYKDGCLWSAGGFGRWSEPGGWRGQIRYPSRPVVGVSWFEAAAYCAWAGCRLPTEAEWERAARGTESRVYPWGNENPDRNRLNFARDIGHPDVGHPTPVGIYPRGATPDGIGDMAGNVWEWCRDWYHENYYKHSPSYDPHGPATGNTRVVRGGSWRNGAGNTRAAFRAGSRPVDRDSDLGFRVVAMPGSRLGRAPSG